MTHEQDHQPSPTAQYLLAALILGMAVAAVLLISRVPAFFGPEGGDPVMAGLLAFAFVVLAVGARLVRPAAMAGREGERGSDADDGDDPSPR